MKERGLAPPFSVIAVALVELAFDDLALDDVAFAASAGRRAAPGNSATVACSISWPSKPFFLPNISLIPLLIFCRGRSRRPAGWQSRSGGPCPPLYHVQPKTPASAGGCRK